MYPPRPEEKERFRSCGSHSRKTGSHQKNQTASRAMSRQNSGLIVGYTSVTRRLRVGYASVTLRREALSAEKKVPRVPTTPFPKRLSGNLLTICLRAAHVRNSGSARRPVSRGRPGSAYFRPPVAVAIVTYSSPLVLRQQLPAITVRVLSNLPHGRGRGVGCFQASQLNLCRKGFRRVKYAYTARQGKE